jgi:hypothetical protein
MAASHSTMFDILVEVGLGEHNIVLSETDSNFAILEMAKPSSIKFSKTSFVIINLGGPHSL